MFVFKTAMLLDRAKQTGMQRASIRYTLLLENIE